VSPCDYRDYPANWKSEIRPLILERAENCCEFCGVPNGAIVTRSKQNGARYEVVFGEWSQKNHTALRRIYQHHGLVLGTRFLGGLSADRWGRPIRVVLTVAHLDHDRTNNVPANLRALCQRCHLRWDAEHHAETRRLRGLGQEDEQTVLNFSGSRRAR